MDGEPDGAAGVRDAAGDGLADPPRRVGGELEALAPVELLDRVHEAEVALLDQVEERETRGLVLLRDRDHQPQVRLHEGPLRVLAAAGGPAQLALLRRGQALRTGGQLLAGGVATLDLLGQAHLVVLGEERVLPDVGQVEPNEIFLVALDTFFRHYLSLLCPGSENAFRPVDLRLDQRSPNGVTTARACLFRRPSLPPCPPRIPEASRSLFHRCLWTRVWTRASGSRVWQTTSSCPSWRARSRARSGREADLAGVLAKYVVVTRNAPGCRNVDLAASIAVPGPVPRDREVGRRRRPGGPPRLGRDGRDGDRRDRACSPGHPISTSTPRSPPTTSE